MAIYNYVFDLYTQQGGPNSSHRVFPVYKELKKTQSKDSNEMFFRTTFEGEITFIDGDFDYIRGFDTTTKFLCRISPLKRLGVLASVEIAFFRYVDIKFDLERKTATTKLYFEDAYNKVLNSLNASYDLSKMGIPRGIVKYDVSDTIQIASAGHTSLFNSYKRVVELREMEPLSVGELANKAFNVENILTCASIRGLDGSSRPGDMPDGYAMGVASANEKFRPPSKQNYDRRLRIGNKPTIDPDDTVNDTYEVYSTIITLSSLMPRVLNAGERVWVEIWANYIPYFHLNQSGAVLIKSVTTYSIKVVDKKADGTETSAIVAGDLLKPIQYDHRLFAYSNMVAGSISRVNSSLSIGGRQVDLKLTNFYYNQIGVRRLTSEGSLGFPIDAEQDPYCRSYLYKRVEPISLNNIFAVSTIFSPVPTEYGAVKSTFGMREPGLKPSVLYYTPPMGTSLFIPFLKEDWDAEKSFWINADLLYGAYLTKQNMVENASTYEIGDVIQALLRNIDSSLTFIKTELCSMFLYGGTSFRLKTYGSPNKPMSIYITQRSNANKPNSDEYAKKSPITLGEVLQLLREAFNLYWFIDNGTFRIEHVSWFMNGGSYGSESASRIFLSRYRDRYSNRLLSEGSGEFSFDLSRDYKTRKLEWADDTSDPFSIGEIEMNEAYDLDKKSQDSVIPKFTADIEYCAVFGKDVSNDGFAIFGCIESNNGAMVVPSVAVREKSAEVQVLNGSLSMVALFSMWLGYNLPTLKGFTLNGYLPINCIFPMYAPKSSVSVPWGLGIKSYYTIIYTLVGAGHIQKISENFDTGYVDLELAYERQKNS